MSAPTDAPREGIAAARRRGACTGRRPALDPERAEQLRERAAAGEPKARLAREPGVSRETVCAYLRPARAATPTTTGPAR